jgi:DNA mismatch repair protein MutS2
MIHPGDIKEKLGFDAIIQQLKQNCLSELGIGLVNALEFTNSRDKIQLDLQQIADFRMYLTEVELPAFGAINPIENLLAKSEIDGNWLDGHELFQVLSNMRAAHILVDFLQGSYQKYQSLKKLERNFALLHELEVVLERSIDEKGSVLDSASGELRAVRRQMISEEGSLRKKINTVFKQAKTNGIVPDGASIGVRDGRMVIPITASHKRQIQGFVHDESSTGNIVYLEPAVILDSNNKIRELQIAESREIRKVLTKLTSLIGDNSADLAASTKFLAKIDLLWAKTKLARSLDANMPVLVADRVSWRALRHPLLEQSFKETKRKVVPHSIELTKEDRILLISGPNAGGKSVALKSVGLNQLMLQHGLLPCAEADSIVRVFSDIILDIGDEQSIDNDLSTYSSHLRNMKLMLSEASADSLILIDEFGSGTDPSFGGAIAEAVLKKLLVNKPFGIITTHFSNLKLFSEDAKGIINAAMLFDLEHLKPLYQLSMGRPGSSFSLEVASQTGLPQEIIEDAKTGVGASQIEIEELLTSLENEKRKYESQNNKLLNKEAELERLQNEYNELKKKLEERQKEIINLAKQEASQILNKTNREIEKTIRHIKENKAEKKETKKIRQSLGRFADKVKTEEKKPVPDDVTIERGEIKVGDNALVTDKNVVVKVLEIKGKKAKVLIGDFQSVVPLRSLTKVSNREIKKIKNKPSIGSLNQAVNSAMTGFSPTLDVRGTRASELLPLLQRFIDEAIMLNQNSIKIIHGKGNGVLRTLIRQELKQWKEVASFENEHIERGGDGATIITLK